MSVNRNKLLGMLKSHPYLDDIAGKYNLNFESKTLLKT